MSRWEPHVDLMRLLDALATEIAATTEQDVHCACAESGWSMAGAAKDARDVIAALDGDAAEPDIDMATADVRELIGAMSSDPDAPDIDMEPSPVELRRARHHRAFEPGSRSCGKQH